MKKVIEIEILSFFWIRKWRNGNFLLINIELMLCIPYGINQLIILGFEIWKFYDITFLYLN